MGSNSGFAVQIVNLNEPYNVRIDLDALVPILEKVGDKPVAVVSVNGPMRTGKSYLLNHFLRFFSTEGGKDWIKKKLPEEFHWKSPPNRQNTGILVWSEPFFLEKDGQQIAVLLMDTQGSFDDQTDYNINYMLFAFSCLLSSVLIYNVKHQISEDVLQFLQMFLGFASMPLEEGVGEPFDCLVMLIRDWENPRAYPYGYHDKDKPEDGNFLKDKLEVGNHMAKDVKEVHKAIISSFKSVSCCLLPHPGSELATEDKTDNINKDFLKALEEFVPKVCAAENIVLKTLGGQIITGHVMAEMVKGWDKLFAKVGCDDIKSLASMAAEKQHEMALCDALDAYKKQLDAINESKDITEDGIKALNDRAQKHAIQIFKNQKKMKYPSIEKNFVKNLKKEMEITFEYYKEINGILKNFNALKAENEEERIRLREEMDTKILDVQTKMVEKAKQEKDEWMQSERVKRDEMEANLKKEWNDIRQDLIAKLTVKDQEMTKLNDQVNKQTENMLAREQQFHEQQNRKDEEMRKLITKNEDIVKNLEIKQMENVQNLQQMKHKIDLQDLEIKHQLKSHEEVLKAKEKLDEELKKKNMKLEEERKKANEWDEEPKRHNMKLEEERKNAKERVEWMQIQRAKRDEMEANFKKEWNDMRQDLIAKLTVKDQEMTKLNDQVNKQTENMLAREQQFHEQQNRKDEEMRKLITKNEDIVKNLEIKQMENVQNLQQMKHKIDLQDLEIKHQLKSHEEVLKAKEKLDEELKKKNMKLEEERKKANEWDEEPKRHNMKLEEERKNAKERVEWMQIQRAKRDEMEANFKKEWNDMRQDLIAKLTVKDQEMTKLNDQVNKQTENMLAREQQEERKKVNERDEEQKRFIMQLEEERKKANERDEEVKRNYMKFEEERKKANEMDEEHKRFNMKFEEALKRKKEGICSQS